MNKEKLMKVFDECNRLRMGIRIELEMPNQEDTEIIINTYRSLNTKRNYYIKTYDNNLVHKNNNKIRIIDAKPIQIKREVKRITLWEDM